MATKNPIQKSSTRARKSKQCVQSTIHRTRNKMDARSMQIPSQINVAQGNSSRELHRLATPQHAECEKILPRNNGNTKRAYEPNAQECEIDKSVQNKQHHTTQRKKSSETSVYMSTMSERQYSQTRQANSPNDHKRGTNTSW